MHIILMIFLYVTILMTFRLLLSRISICFDVDISFFSIMILINIVNQLPIIIVIVIVLFILLLILLILHQLSNLIQYHTLIISIFYIIFIPIFICLLVDLELSVFYKVNQRSQIILISINICIIINHDLFFIGGWNLMICLFTFLGFLSLEADLTLQNIYNRPFINIIPIVTITTILLHHLNLRTNNIVLAILQF